MKNRYPTVPKSVEMENNFVNENKDRLGIHRMNEISDMCVFVCVCALSQKMNTG